MKHKNILHFLNSGSIKLLNLFAVFAVNFCNTLIFFNKLNFFGKMNTLKNAAKLLICGFAILGLAACSSGGSGGSATSAGGNVTITEPPVNIPLGDVNQNALSNFTLTSINTTLLTAVEETIAAHSATSITVTITNNDSNVEQATTITIDANDDWKTEEIGFPTDLTDGLNNLTITVTYSGNNPISAETTTSLTVTYDGTLPSITSFTDQSVDIPSFLPITDVQNFTFTITFSEPITAGSLTILTNPTGLVTNAIAFNDANTVATITATPTIPANQTGTLTISVTGYEDGFGNGPALAEQVLYEEIDIQLPTVADIGSQPTDITDNYIVTYTFSEEVQTLTDSNFTITDNNVTITDVTHDISVVMLAITSTVDIIDITVTDFIDTVGNKGSGTDSVRLNDISVFQANSIIGDDDITAISDNYKFTLIFNRLIPASTLTTSDFVNTNSNSNIQIVSFTPDTGDAQNLEVVFSITDENDTAAVEFTIAAGAVGIGNITNSEDIVISIDRGPRFLSIPENSKTEFNKDDLGNGSEISYTLTFSEAIDGLVADDFIIEPDSDGVSVESVSVNSAAATVVFTVAEDTEGTFSIDLTADSYTDQAGNGNREVTVPILSNIIIDTIDPEISISDFDAETNTLTLEFSEVVTVASTDIVLTNATINTFTIDNSGEKSTAVAVFSIDISQTEAEITLNKADYSDTLGNVGGNDYTLTIDIEALLLTLGECQNFSFDGGDGSTDTPYQISNICQLQNIAADDITADGVAYTNLLDKSYILTENIDATYTSNWDSGKGFNPVGHDNNSNDGDGFDGTFDGANFTLSNLTINRSAEDYIGVFGYNLGTIKDITVDSVNITGKDSVGGLVGENFGTINNSNVSGNVEGNNDIGGLVGVNSGNIENSNSSGSVEGTSNVAGFVGRNDGTINDGSFSGNVKGNSIVGGFIGANQVGTILSSSTSGSVEGNLSVGGFIGQGQYGTVHDNTSDVSIVEVEDAIQLGGFIGLVALLGSYSGNKWCQQSDNGGLFQTGNVGGEDIAGITTLAANCEN